MRETSAPQRGSRTPVISKRKVFVAIVHGWKPLTIVPAWCPGEINSSELNNDLQKISHLAYQ